MQSVNLLAIATANPPGVVRQTDLVPLVREHYHQKGNAFARVFDRLEPAFTNAGIDKRHISMPQDWFLTDLDWGRRNHAYLDVAKDLYCEAVTAALEQADLAASELDILITISSTGIATPSLEAQVGDRMGFREDVMRVPVFGLGCAGGVSGVGLGTQLARANPGLNVLVVALELCSLSFRSDRDAKSDIIATALFGDGAAAVILNTGSAHNARARLGGFTEHRWSDSLDIMGWSVDAVGMGAIFSRSIPDLVQTKYRDAADAALARLGSSLDALNLHAFHPGGTKVLEALEDVLELEQGALNRERDVLRDFGNMSAPTVLFVLERVLASQPSGEGLLAALGPGFTASFGRFSC